MRGGIIADAQGVNAKCAWQGRFLAEHQNIFNLFGIHAVRWVNDDRFVQLYVQVLYAICIRSAQTKPIRKRVLTSKRANRLIFGDKAVARLTGLEPATPGVTGRYSNQLSYNRASACSGNPERGPLLSASARAVKHSQRSGRGINSASSPGGN